MDPYGYALTAFAFDSLSLGEVISSNWGATKTAELISL